MRFMNTRLAVIAAGFWFCCSSAFAGEIVVPRDHATVQQAIDSAQAGDVVVIENGTYKQALKFKSGVALRGRFPLGAIIESDDPLVPVIEITNCANAQVSALTIRYTGEKAFPVPDPAKCVIEATDSAVEIVDCDISGGAMSGVLFQGSGNSTIRNCDVHANLAHGICVDGAGVNVLIEENSCSNNEASGVVVLGDGTGAAINGCVMKDNKFFGMWLADGVAVTTKNNDYTHNAQINNREVFALFQNDQFDHIETIAARLRKDKVRFPSGNWQLNHFYDYLVPEARTLSDEGLRDREKTIDRWKARHPDSITWRIVLADLYLGQAWKARGTGFIDTVAQSYLAQYRSFIQKAKTILDNAATVPEKDPEYYVKLAAVNLETPDQSAGLIQTILSTIVGAENDAATAFNAGIALEPLYLPLYEERVRALLPRWGGSVEEMMTFANDTAARYPDGDGDALYAFVAAQVCSWEGVAVYLNEYSFSWERVQRGYDHFLKQFPKSHYRRNQFAWMSCAHPDQTTAGRIFTELGDH